VEVQQRGSPVCMHPDMQCWYRVSEPDSTATGKASSALLLLCCSLLFCWTPAYKAQLHECYGGLIFTALQKLFSPLQPMVVVSLGVWCRGTLTDWQLSPAEMQHKVRGLGWPLTLHSTCIPRRPQRCLGFKSKGRLTAQWSSALPGSLCSCELCLVWRNTGDLRVAGAHMFPHISACTG
jgi:hypothetical protein